MTIIGLDIGRSAVKAYTGTNMFSFPSVIGEWRERNLRTDYGDNAIEGEFLGERFFAGTLAQNESEFARSMMTTNKAHDDTRLLALIALHRARVNDVIVITGLPVDQHNDENKRALRNLLVGEWRITVGGVTSTIRVRDVKVAVEGGAAFWSSPVDGLVRLIDAGSKTVNFVTMSSRRYVDRDSGTLPFGYNTNKSSDRRQMANRIAGELGRKWNAEDTVIVSGGRAEELSSMLRTHFPKAQPLPNALYANAIGYYRIGVTTNVTR